jgi:hypothetical protein
LAGLFLVAAAVLFWMSWLLMPGVGVTDAEQIFALVSAQRPLVATSVLIQLLSAVFYVPALLGAVSDTDLGRVPGLRWRAGLMLVGAMGSAADAVLHLLAYAMTAPDLDRGPLVHVMAFMQGPGLLLLAPLIASYFLGGAALSLGLVRVGLLSHWGVRLHGAAVAVAVIGGALAMFGQVAPRAVGLTALGLVSGAQVWAGVAMWNVARSSSGARTRTLLPPAAGAAATR